MFRKTKNMNYQQCNLFRISDESEMTWSPLLFETVAWSRLECQWVVGVWCSGNREKQI